MSVEPDKLAGLSSEQKRALLRELLEKRVNRTQSYAASLGQRRLWLQNKLEGAKPTYNMKFALRFRGALRVDALQAAVNAVIGRHDALRTAFAERDGEPRQVVAPSLTLALPLLDLSDRPADRRLELARTKALEEARKPFDLEKGPLLRAALIKLADDDHVFTLVMHHIITDGVSMGVFVREAAAIYAAEVEGRAEPLPAPPIQYPQFAERQRQALQSERLQAQLDYWKQRLAGAPALLELPLDWPRPPAQSFRGARETFLIDDALYRQVKQLSRRAGATLFMTLQTVFAVLLARYSGRRDVVVGSPNAGRARPELRTAIGYFVNELLLRTDLSGSSNFLDLVRQTRQTVRDAYAHGDAPFDLLIQELEPERRADHNPLFQVAFVLQNAEDERFTLPELDASFLDIDSGTVKLDLHFSLKEAPNAGMIGAFEYAVDLFAPETMRRMGEHYTALLRGVVAEPERRVLDLPMLGEAERETLLRAWNAAVDEPGQGCIHDLVASAAERFANRPAAATADAGETESWTYAELDRRANRIAHFLAERGIGPETTVGVAVRRSPELAAAMLGALKAGAAYLPLDPEYPGERLAYLMADSGMAALIAHSETLDALPAYELQFLPQLILDEDLAPDDRHADASPRCGATPQNLAYVIYTSGSTGRPKGVQAAHDGLRRLASSQARAFEVDAESRVLQVASMGFDASISEMFMALVSGAALFFPEPKTAMVGRDLEKSLTAHEITHVTLVPSALATLEPRALASVRSLIVAGEACSAELAARFAPGRRFFNAYGPTETTVCASIGRLDRPDRAAPPIGKPLPGAPVYVLDDRLQPTPIGVPGELCVAGGALTRGYLNRPDLTAAAFIPDPFDETGGGRLYRTGDRVRWLARGELSYLGRRDDQVKIRGFRVELGEIESQLARASGVRQALAMLRRDDGEPALIAYALLESEPVEGDSERLRRFLGERLPEHMVPAHVVAVAEFPLTPHGKIDRKALPRPAAGGAGQAYRAPRNQVEATLAGIWTELLPVARVGVDDHFFELGGHSLMGAQLMARLRDVYGLELSLQTLFAAPTVAQFGLALEEAMRENRAVDGEPIEAVDRDRDLPLSFAQQRLWFLDRLDGGGAAYNIAAALEMRGLLRVDVLEAALAAMVRRHEGLRAVFDRVGGQPVQRVAEPWAVNLPVIDLGGLDAGPRRSLERALIQADLETPFDLRAGRPLRLALTRGGGDRCVLLTAMHHIISDGWSMSVFIRETAALYRRLGEDPAAGDGLLPALPVQAADYACWQQRLLQSDRLREQVAYWKQKLAGAPEAIDLPFDRPRPEVQTFAGDKRRFNAPAALRQGVAALGRDRGATPFMPLLAAFAALLSRYSGQTTVAIGAPVANRGRAELEPLIGLFVNTLVMRVDVDEAASFAGLVDQVRGTALEAYAHQDAPFEKLVEALKPRRNLSHAPLFQVMFVMQNAPAAELSLPGLALRPLPAAGGHAKFDLTLFVTETDAGLEGLFEYNTDLFDGATIERLATGWLALLEAAVAEPDASLAELPAMPADARRRLLVEWQGENAALPTGSSVRRWFEDQARRTPQAPALMIAGAGADEAFEIETLAYGEMDRRANRLARFLKDNGAGPDVLVGVMVEPSPDMAVAVLGALKAGAAYLPLEPDYPQERLAYMIADAGAPIVVAQSALADRIVGGATRVVVLDGADRPDIEACSDAPIKEEPDPNCLAYAIYTSGSTGAPKGVLATRRSLAASTYARARRYGDAPARFLLLSSLSFDSSVAGLFQTWTQGGGLVSPRAEVRRDPAALARLIEALKIERLLCIPSLLAALIRRAGEGELVGLRQAVVAGEACPGKLVRDFRRVAPNAELHNEYGPTEATVWATVHDCRGEDGGRMPAIGKPIANARVYLLDRYMRPVPVGVAGQIYIGGAGLTRGYLNRSGLTAARFTPDPFADETGGVGGERLYRTGDLARWRPDGAIEFLGRADDQVKLRGYRIELGEIEEALGRCQAVAEAAAAVREPGDAGLGGDRRLAAFIVLADGAGDVDWRAFLGERLPAYMVPAEIHVRERLPRTPNGKVDRQALLASLTRRPDAAAPRAVAATRVERAIARIWQTALQRESVGLDENFFEIGGHSLLMAQVQESLEQSLDRAIPMTALFRHPTIRQLARFLTGDAEPAPAAAPAAAVSETAAVKGRDIAVVAMAGRFPGAADVDAFWRNLRDGVESIRSVTEEDALAAGADPALVRRPDYVKAAAWLDGTELFDAAFFDMTPAEADTTDPQHRLFLEVAWEAFERAGCDTERYPGAIGVYAGVSANSYLINNLATRPDLMAALGDFQTVMRNDKDFFATRLSYKLNLRGPSVNVQTACSTSLTAVHMAVRALRAGECDMALAGGCCARASQKRGYLYQEGMVNSPDGRCRAFDADARGVVGGNGVGAVVLKRLEDALTDGDVIHAVIKGTALNNDGSAKVGYTAPSVEGQAAVIAAALADAGVSADEIGYVEAHGTATALGDPIEIDALNRAFRPQTDRTGYCAIGSVKTNVGHLDTAAGVAGLIKAALALERRSLPPSLNYRRANPAIDFENSPFFVNAELRSWEGPEPRRAGVSSFGIGGTNAHVVLEEAPAQPEPRPPEPYALLTLSAKTETALDAAAANLADFLEARPQRLADAAYTLQVGRRSFDHRRFWVCRDAGHAVALLRDETAGWRGRTAGHERPVVFMFPGQGGQFAGATAELYRCEPVFRHWLDRCAELLAPHLDADLRQWLHPEPDRVAEADRRLLQTDAAQPALFAVCYALAKLWMARGVTPDAMIGHSLGEYTAACLAGVFSLEDGLALVAERARLMAAAPAGAMLAAPLAEAETTALLAEDLALAAVNAPDRCVVSGSAAAVEALSARLETDRKPCRPLAVERAFHSPMMDPVVEPFRQALARIALRPPQTPYIANLTGAWVEAGQATDPEHWVAHLRQTVRFADGVALLQRDLAPVFLEVGPGRALCDFAARGETDGARPVVVPSLGGARRAGSADLADFLTARGRLWLAGASLDWQAGAKGRRVVLPTYPFERARHWIEPARGPSSATRPVAARAAAKNPEIDQWFYLPAWKPAPPPEPAAGAPRRRWLALTDDSPLMTNALAALRAAGDETIAVRPGVAFDEDSDGFRVDPASSADFETLLETLSARGQEPDAALHGWLLDPAARRGAVDAGLDRGFFAMLGLAQAMAKRRFSVDTPLVALTDCSFQAAGVETPDPAGAALAGLCRVIPQEYAHLRARAIDLEVPAATPGARRLAARMTLELRAGDEPLVAYRGRRRLLPGYEPARLAEPERPAFRQDGVYLITGGWGQVGFAMAERLAEQFQAKLALVGRSAFPSRDQWDAILEGDDDRLAARVRRVRELEAGGAQFLSLAADVADAAALGRAIEEAAERFGALHGVIHAAGLTGDSAFHPLQTAGRADSQAQFRAKAHGAMALVQALDGRALDFCLAVSSLAAILGGLGFAAYAAANAFLDAFALGQNDDESTPWLTVNWDGWRFEEQASESGVGALAMTPAEGVDALARLAARPELGQVVVSTGDLDARLAQWTARAEPAGETPDAVPDVAARQRPDLATAYAEPRTDTERALCGILGELLGIAPIGVHDDFFDLGGDSLMAAQLLSRMRDAFQTDIPLNGVFERPTVAAQAELIEALRVVRERGGDDADWEGGEI